MNTHNLLIEKIASHQVDTPALSDGASSELTYGELIKEVNITAEMLLQSEVGGVAIIGDNSVAQVVLDLACLQADIWTLQIPPFFTDDQVMHALRESGCRHVIGDIAAIPGGIPNRQADSLEIAGRPMYLYSSSKSPCDLVPPATAKVTFTSGSTAQPKGLCLSQENLFSPVVAIASELASLELSRHLSVLPQAVLLETIAGIYTTLYTGGLCAIPSLHDTSGAVDPGSALCRSLESHRAHSAILVPELLEQLMHACKYNKSCSESLRFVAVGGSRVRNGLLQRARDEGIPVFEGYGLSEAGSVVTLNLPHKFRSGSVGKVLSHQQLSIDPTGEIILERQGFIGYCGRQMPLPSAGGFPTGDCGFIDDEGFLYVDGRLKNILITGMGRNVSPEWVESVLTDQSAISQSLVFGDAQATLSALIVSAESSARVQQAVDAANKGLPDYARVHRWQRVAPFTKDNGLLTANGKLKRKAILAGCCETLL